MAAPMVSGALALLAEAYPPIIRRIWRMCCSRPPRNLGAKTAEDNAAYGYGMATMALWIRLIRVDRASWARKRSPQAPR